MNLYEYQQEASKLRFYPGERGSKEALAYATLGLAGESGEVADNVKKVIRGAWQPGEVSEAEYRERIFDELGDVMWYVSQVAAEVGASLDDIATVNIAKLRRRMADREKALDKQAHDKYIRSGGFPEEGQR